MGRKLLIALGLFSACNSAGIWAPKAVVVPLTSSCDFDHPKDPNRAVLAFFTAGDSAKRDLNYLLADGSTKVVHTFEFAAPNPQYVPMVSATPDGVFAQSAAYSSSAGGTIWQSELVRIDRQGKLVWRQTFPANVTSQVGQDGTVAVYAVIDGHGATTVFRSDGRTSTLDSKIPVLPPLADGSLLVQSDSLQAEPRPLALSDLERGRTWWRTDREESQPLEIPSDNSMTPILVNGRAVYFANREGARVLVLATPDHSLTISLPADDQSWSAIPSRLGKWMELVRYAESSLTVLRVDTETGALDQVEEQIPDGLRRIGYVPMIADDGALIEALRNDYIGGMYRSVDGRVWTQIGFSISDVDAFDVRTNRAGTLVANFWARSTYGLPVKWPEPPQGVVVELPGDEVQLARPSDQLRYSLPSANVALDESGLCAAYNRIGDSQSTFEILDLTHGRTFTIADQTGQLHLDSIAWLDQ